MSHLGIRSAAPGDEAAVVGVILLAFAADPFVRWAAPDAGRYVAAMPAIVHAFGGNGFAHGSVHVPEGGGAAAMWLPPGVEPDSERMAALMPDFVAADRMADLDGVMEGMAAAHPQEPHWYLPLIGVEPRLQGQGLGAALLRHALARCDADGLPAYLESTNPRNISLYLRHGFEVRDTFQSGSSPPVVAMLRRPR